MPAHILGSMGNQPHCGLSENYFVQRDCWVDCRGEDCLHIDKEANIGWCVNLITLSHGINDPPNYGALIPKKIIIEKYAFIFAFATLYNCYIKEGGIVAAGSVVRNMTVEPYTMVEGNPAKVVKKYNPLLKKWEKV